MSPIICLSDLQPFEYEHPFDAKALDALQKVAGLDTLVRQFYKNYWERLIRIEKTGGGIKISPESYPQIYEPLNLACDTINLSSRPDFYLGWGYSVNGYTTGVDNPIIVLDSGAIDLLDKAEQLFVIGHEIGHIKSGHLLYHTIAEYLPAVINVVGEATLGIGRLLSAPAQYMLFRWCRMSEFTADRAGLLACQDLNASIRVMMKMSGLPLNHHQSIQVESFMQQARDFEKLSYDDLNKALKFLSTMNQTHPWTVLRAAELLRWVESGEYQMILERKTRYRWAVREDGPNRFCRKCGHQLAGNERFCTTCGGSLTVSEHGDD